MEYSFLASAKYLSFTDTGKVIHLLLFVRSSHSLNTLHYVNTNHFNNCYFSALCIVETWHITKKYRVSRLLETCGRVIQVTVCQQHLKFQPQKIFILWNTLLCPEPFVLCQIPEQKCSKLCNLPVSREQQVLV